jgi:GTP pyrophosphokinase
MHRVAEYGIAAHWKYKNGGIKSREEVDRKLEWVAKLVEINGETMDPDEFLSTLKIDIFHDETFVFTPKGDVIVLPQGATLIDFAYAIHSAIGNKMIGAKINGAIAPIDSIPKNGEIVEILTSSASKGPSRDWLKIVRTSEARTKIRQWFKKEKRSENIVVGRNEIDKEFKKYQRQYNDAQRSEILTNVAHRIGIKTEEDLLNTIGYGGLSVAKIAGRLKDEFDRIVKVVQPAPITTPETVQTVLPTKRHKSGGGIIVDGQSGCLVKFAKCCNPLPGDKVIGFITKGYGISIHKSDCPNIKESLENAENSERFVDAHWDMESNIVANHTYDAFVQIFAEQSISLLADVTAALAEMKVSLLSINYQTKNDGDVVINLNIACRNLDHVGSIVSRLRAVRGVSDVKRGFGA